MGNWASKRHELYTQNLGKTFGTYVNTMPHYNLVLVSAQPFAVKEPNNVKIQRKRATKIQKKAYIYY